MYNSGFIGCSFGGHVARRKIAKSKNTHVLASEGTGSCATPLSARPVAIKVFSGGIEYFENEVSRLRELAAGSGYSEGKIHVQELLQAGAELVPHTDGEYKLYPYIITELATCDLGSLPRPISDSLRAAFVRDLLRAVEYIHAAGLIHTDIKPGNILIKGEHLVLADYDTMTRQDNIFDHFVGTAGYYSPESATGEISQAMDIWAAGCVIHEILYDRCVFGTCDICAACEDAGKSKSRRTSLAPGGSRPRSPALALSETAADTDGEADECENNAPSADEEELSDDAEEQCSDADNTTPAGSVRAGSSHSSWSFGSGGSVRVRSDTSTSGCSAVSERTLAYDCAVREYLDGAAEWFLACDDGALDGLITSALVERDSRPTASQMLALYALGAGLYKALPATGGVSCGALPTTGVLSPAVFRTGGVSPGEK